jgi:hypothetical protein
MNSSNTNTPCHFYHFGLIVTGEGEAESQYSKYREDGLPRLFCALMTTGKCSFKVIRRIGQLSPPTSEKRLKRLSVVGTHKSIPNKYQSISLEVRSYLSKSPCQYVLLIDDLEHERAERADPVFQRYRQILEGCLESNNQRQRVAVHLLVNMLEACYFADANAINQVLGTQLQDYPGDVETIRHPKNKLKFNKRTSMRKPIVKTTNNVLSKYRKGELLIEFLGFPKDSQPFLVLEKAELYGCYWRNGKWNWKKNGV